MGPQPLTFLTLPNVMQLAVPVTTQMGYVATSHPLITAQYQIVFMVALPVTVTVSVLHLDHTRIPIRAARLAIRTLFLIRHHLMTRIWIVVTRMLLVQSLGQIHSLIVFQGLLMPATCAALDLLMPQRHIPQASLFGSL